MKRWVIMAFALVCASFVLAVPWLLNRYTHPPTWAGARDFHQITAQQLERDVRARVPLGSNPAFVETFLRNDGMLFTFDTSSLVIRANAPRVKGSSWLIYESVGFTFQFDDSSKLKSISSKVSLTGP
jgi:hypothetical protein